MEPASIEDFEKFQDWYETNYHTGDSRTDMQRAYFAARNKYNPLLEDKHED